MSITGKFKCHILRLFHCRLQMAIGKIPRDSKVVTKSESLLLDTHRVTIPTIDDLDFSVSVDIIKNFHPVLLLDVYPAETYVVEAQVICSKRLRKHNWSIHKFFINSFWYSILNTYNLYNILSNSWRFEQDWLNSFREPVC